MISHEFEFLTPTSVQEALRVLGQHGEEAKVLAGGMSLLPMMNLALVEPQVLVSLNHIPDWDYANEDGQGLRLGAMVRHHQIASSALVKRLCPPLAQAAAVIGDVQVRHRGTLGGSLAHADPAADYLPVMVAVDAQLKILGPSGERTMAARDFVIDVMTTALQPGELITEVLVPNQPNNSRSAYLRFARVEGSFPIVNAAAVVGESAAAVALGGVASRPIRFSVSADFERKREDAFELLDIAADIACEEIYGTGADYRQSLARTYAHRAVRQAIQG
jgi:aerobic carbon-monoxide dehydrogenase medium subunit